MYGNVIDQLIDALRVLPGVGNKSAQRMALHLLERDRSGATRLAESLVEAVEKVGRCAQCRTLTEHEVCAICRNERRLADQICVVENRGGCGKGQGDMGRAVGGEEVEAAEGPGGGEG